jgi:DnaJ-class molecular chaperone
VDTKVCPNCNGAAEIEKLEDCGACSGKGKIIVPGAEIYCNTCQGQGKIRVVEPCVACAATGRVALNPSAPVKEPPVDNSVEARLARAELRLAELEKNIKTQ